MSNSNSNNIIIKRLKTEMDRVGINARELAERANVGRSFVYDILSGKSENPTTKKLSAIADVLGVNVLYLLGDEKKALETTKREDTSQLVSIASLQIEASAGGGTIVNDEKESDKYFYFEKSWIKNVLNASPNDLRIISVTGDSMYPTLWDGDNVLVDIRQNYASPPGIFVLFDGIGLVVKRLETMPDTGLVRIISDNPQYPQYKRSLGEIKIIGRVVWFSRKI